MNLTSRIAAFVFAVIFLHVCIATAKPSVETVTASELHAKIASHRGHVVVVNFWATWCPGCIEEFPNLVKLQRNYAARGIDVLFVSADDTTDRPKVVDFLANRGVTRTSYLMRNNMSVFLGTFDPQWKDAYALPRTYIYNRRGQRSKILTMPASYSGFRDAIKSLL